MKFRLFCKLFGSLSCYSKTMLLKVTVEQWHAKSTHGKSWMEEVNDTIKRLENHGSPRTFSMDQVKGTWFFGLLMWFCGFACKLARTTPTTPSPEIAQQKYTQICTHTHMYIIAFVRTPTRANFGCCFVQDCKCIAILNNLSAEIGGLCSPIYEVFQDNYLWWVTYQKVFPDKIDTFRGVHVTNILHTYVCDICLLFCMLQTKRGRNSSFPQFLQPRLDSTEQGKRGKRSLSVEPCRNRKGWLIYVGRYTMPMIGIICSPGIGQNCFCSHVTSQELTTMISDDICCTCTSTFYILYRTQGFRCLPKEQVT